LTKHVVGFSGGIDSQACAGWVLDHFPKDDVILLNSQAGRNEHPMTVEHIAWYSDNVHPVIEIVPRIKDLGNRGTMPGKTRDRRQEYSDEDEMDFADLAYIKGRFPSRKAQFCTEHLKLAPQRRWCDENLTSLGIDYERYAGVRRDESQARKDTPDCKWDEYFDTTLHFPIASWTKPECFEFCKRRGEKINPLYSLGFGRVGCAPCINSGKDDVREWAARFPEMIDKVREWERRVGRTFFAPCVPGKVMNFIDEVVEWSKTTRGGQQFALPFVEADAASGSCASKYGLCE
jgi:3'-phosphoadenosine 5'-phosphosulfate sulfotransferase (PAPS reductase)/FAD synthetase